MGPVQSQFRARGAHNIEKADGAKEILDGRARQLFTAQGREFGRHTPQSSSPILADEDRKGLLEHFDHVLLKNPILESRIGSEGKSYFMSEHDNGTDSNSDLQGRDDFSRMVGALGFPNVLASGLSAQNLHELDHIRGRKVCGRWLQNL